MAFQNVLFAVQVICSILIARIVCDIIYKRTLNPLSSMQLEYL